MKNLKALFLLLMALFLWCCQPGDTNSPREENFSNNWNFFAIPIQKGAKEVQKTNVQSGSRWKSQFFVEHTATSSVHSSISEETLKNEWAFLKTAEWEKITLPHTAYIEPLTVNNQWEGICYYQKNFKLFPSDKDKKIFLEFQGAMQLADVWVNGKHMAQHAGGYDPFEIDLSDVVQFDTPNEVLVRLDNRDNPIIPPGKPLGNLDFCYYSGLYREVLLRKTNPIHISNPISANKVAGGGIFVSYSDVSKKSAKVHVQTHVLNQSNTQSEIFLLHQLIDWQGNTVKEETVSKIQIKKNGEYTSETSFEVKNPNLWNPDNPYLYTLRTTVFEKRQKIDQKDTRIGIRWMEYSRKEGLKLNGTPIRLVGSNRHMEYPYIGNALSKEAHYRDMVKIKNGGFNTVRLGHYPQDPSVLEACDELGLLAIEPIPGWQYYNNDSTFNHRTFRDIRQMIRRDRNHPSIIMWETILNESWPPVWWRDKANQITHKEHPGQQCFTAGDMYGYFGWDILYNDWSENHNRPNNSKKPGFIREYGDYEFGGGNSTTRQPRGSGEELLLQSAWNFIWSHNKHRSQYPWTIGDAVWEMFDHNRGCCEGISTSGVSDILRIPKFTWHFFRSQLSPGTPLAGGIMKPEVFIANYWTPQTSPSKVVVFGNVEEVELEVNGKVIAHQKPDNGPDTPYCDDPAHKRHLGGTPFNGGNCQNLNHPPFTFSNIPWEEGTLKAIGYQKGKKVCTYQVRTPQKAAKIGIEMDISDKEPVASGNDVLFVYARIEDSNGTLCVLDQTPISVSITGAKLLSPPSVDAEAGIATFLIQTFEEPGQIKINAKTSSGLKGTASFKTVNQKK